MHGDLSRDVTVTLTVLPDRSHATVKLGGDLDMDARPEVDDAVNRLTATARVDVDVAALTYVGSVLPNFLVQIRNAVPAGSVLTVSRPSPWTHFILRVTDMAQIAGIDDAVPARDRGSDQDVGAPPRASAHLMQAGQALDDLANETRRGRRRQPGTDLLVPETRGPGRG
jgi:anti-anti-sigma regulatory factor